MNVDWKGHAIDFLKGLAAAMVVAGLEAGAQYIGAHLPQTITMLSTVLAAYGTIRATS